MPRLAPALVAAALALAACASTDPPGTDDAASTPPSASPTPTRSAEPAPGPDSEAVRHESARGAAQAWLAAVAEGRWDDAFALLTPRSRQAVGGRDGFADQRTALSEGWGAFSAADPRLHIAEVERGAGAVTVQAEVTRGGTTEQAAVVLPYELQDDRSVLLDVFARADGTARTDDVQNGADLTAGAEVTVVVPPAEKGALALGSTPLESTGTPEDGGLRLQAALPAPFPERTWTALTAVWLDLDGRVGATAWSVSVAGGDTGAGGAPALSQTCRNHVAGIDVRYPEGWTARQFGPDGGCAYFDPEPFEVPENTEITGVDVVLDVEHVPYEQVRDGYLSDEVLERSGSEPAGLPGERLVVRSEQGPVGPGGVVLAHVAELGPDRTLVLRSREADSDDPERARSVTDAMAGALVLVPRQPQEPQEPREPTAPFPADRSPDHGTPDGNGLSVVDVRIGTHPGYDRVVFELDGEGVVGWRVEYDDDPRRQGSGEPVELRGSAALALSISGVGYPMDTGVEEYDGPDRLVPGHPVVQEVLVGGVYEGYLDAFIGVAQDRPFRAFRLDDPQRLVVDVAHAG